MNDRESGLLLDISIEAHSTANSFQSRIAVCVSISDSEDESAVCLFFYFACIAPFLYKVFDVLCRIMIVYLN